MTEQQSDAALPDVPSRVFESFLEELGAQGVAPQVIAKLRACLLQEKQYSDRALKDAVLDEDAP